MSNPFPGMDPYLEGDLWMSVHTDLCSEIARQLAPKVRPKYVVRSTRRVVPVPPEPIPHTSIEIRDVAKRRLVTRIEVLSATNKFGPGREEYAHMRSAILVDAANLLELDLLRVGARLPDSDKLPATPYYIWLTRAKNRMNAYVWPIMLESPLPYVPVPLLEPGADVALDLQRALSTIYDIFGYDDLVDYNLAPPGNMQSEQLDWINEQLIRKGRRSAN
jgi:hypothetical protein